MERRPRYSVSEYLSTPETLAPQELVYGDVREAPGPAASHQTVVGNLYTALRTHLVQTGAGRVWLSPIDIVLDSERGLVLQPDLIVVLKERLHIVSDRVWGAPDLTIEVLSPQPRIGEVAERIAWFARYGVRECWLVRQLPADVEVITFGAGEVTGRRVFAADARIESVVLPASRIMPADVFTSW